MGYCSFWLLNKHSIICIKIYPYLLHCLWKRMEIKAENRNRQMRKLSLLRKTLPRYENEIPKTWSLHAPLDDESPAKKLLYETPTANFTAALRKRQREWWKNHSLNCTTDENEIADGKGLRTINLIINCTSFPLGYRK